MSIDRSKISWNGWGWAAHKDALTGREEVWTWLASELGMPSLLATPPRNIADVTLPASRLPVDTRAKLVASTDRLFAALRRGLLRIPRPTRMPLREAAAAHRALEGRGTTGATVLIP